MARTVRMIPAGTTPGQSGGAFGVVNGRPYKIAANGVADVPEFDANLLEGQGFVRVAWSGPTSARPKPGDIEFSSTGASMAGFRFLDSTLGKEIVSDATGTWRDPVTGAAV